MTHPAPDSPISVLYIPHGGGPLPLLGDPNHHQLVDFLRAISTQISRPSAIVVISAHWEHQVVSITSASSPSLIYDYAGFPEESYHIQYPAPGHPQLAQTIFHALQNKGIACNLDDRRGFDHGLFVPLKIMYPEANIPCLQISLLSSLDPQAHIELGQALYGLNEENILVLGSGLSFHNLKALFSQQAGQRDKQNEAFEDWLVDTCTGTVLSTQQRLQRLVNWTEAPFARYCHPREEHLLPLQVCFGVKQSAARLVFDGEIMGKRSTAYLW
jgi:aromatic ring-opening dioxygenase catalytic subunit (LigB family)